MNLAVLAVIFSAFLHPMMASFSKKAAHPLTLNFLGVILAVSFFSYEFFDLDFWQRVVEYKEIIIISALLHSTYMMIMLSLVAKHEFQVLYPLTRLSPILILIGEIFWFSAKFTFFQILGIGMILSGALVLGFDRKIAHIRWQILGQILLIAFLTAGYFLVDKQLLRIFSTNEMWAMVGFQIPLLMYIVFPKKEALKKDLKNWKNLLGFTFSMVGTWYLALFALQTLDGAVVSSVRNLSILFGVFLGAHLFKEGHKWLRYIAAIFICTGVFFVLG